MSARPGVVYLVGAGPGDPGLMTARALELIASADVILHDRLIPDGALAGARADAELVYVGKRPGDNAMEQEEIEALMVERARAGRSVVRLKGGDPFVFGRGGEEAETLRRRRDRVRGRPRRHGRRRRPGLRRDPGHPSRRRLGGRVRHRPRGPGEARDGARLGRARELSRHAGPLHGGQEPAADRRAPRRRGARSGRAGRRDRARHPAGQRTRDRDAGRAAGRGRRGRPGAPAILLFGPVAARRERIAWLERRPLHGKRVVVTRARAQASGLAATLRELGAEVVELPAIRIEPRLGHRRRSRRGRRPAHATRWSA